MTQVTISELLRRYRIELGLTQKQVGQQIEYDHSFVSRIERGEYIPTEDYLKKFCTKLSLSTPEREAVLAFLNDDNLLISDRVDWGTFPRVTRFYNRVQPLEQLNNWAGSPKVNFIGLFGIGGVGKTWLAAKFVKSMQTHFDIVFWRTLTTPYPAIDFLAELINGLSDPVQQPPSQNLAQATLQLKSLLESRRCLIILDNFESVLLQQEGGKYHPEFEPYKYLIEQIGCTDHQSCFLITSRYKPDELSLLEGEDSSIRVYNLDGFESEACQELLQNKKVPATREKAKQLCLAVSGNPLALTIMAELIHEVYQNDIAAFLEGQNSLPRRINDILIEQILKLSHLEQQIMIWLAVERRPISITQLTHLLFQPNQKYEIAEALQRLMRRSLIELSPAGFGLQTMVMDALLAYLVDQICAEIEKDSFDYLGAFSLLNPLAPEHIQQAQKRMLQRPIINQLLFKSGSTTAVVKRLRHILIQMQMRERSQRDKYIVGNCLGLLIQMRADLRGLDLSDLTICRVDFREVSLPNVNLSGSTCVDCVFHETFGHLLDISFSPNGRLLAASTTNGNIHIWEAENFHKIQILNIDKNWVRSFDWHPDSNGLVTGSSGLTDSLINLWQVESGNRIKTVGTHPTRIRAVAYSADGTIIISGSEDNSVKIWEAEMTPASSGRQAVCRHTLHGHEAAVWDVAIHPNNQLIATASADHIVRLWDARSGQLIQELKGHTDWVTAVSFSTDGTLLASGSKDNSTRLWQVDTGHCKAVLQGHDSWVRDVAFHPHKQQLATCSADKTIRLWNVDSYQSEQVLTGHGGLVESISFSPDGDHLISGSADQTIRLWQLQSGHCVRKMVGYKNPMWSVKFSSNGSQIISGSNNGIVTVWDAQTGKLQYDVHAHSDWAKSIAVHPHKKLIACGSSDKTISLIHSETHQIEARLEGHTSWVSSIDFSPDGRLLASGSGDHTICLWDVETGMKRGALQGHSGRIWCVRFSPNGRLLATASDDATIRLWDTTTNHLIETLTHHSGTVYALAFTPDGNHLLSSGSDRIVRLWNLPQQKMVTAVSAELAAIWDIAIHPFKPILAVALSDHTVAILDSVSLKTKAVLKGHNRPVWAVDFHKDGDVLCSCGDDETIKIWEMESGNCIKTMSAERPYQSLNIFNIKGLTLAQKQSLFALGAVENNQE